MVVVMMEVRGMGDHSMDLSRELIAIRGTTVEGGHCLTKEVLIMLILGGASMTSAEVEIMLVLGTTTLTQWMTIGTGNRHRLDLEKIEHAVVLRIQVE
jgi:hypothetical protein